ncbi:hypothetical protein [Riemerella anatipestifer]|uniref:hypothetical protein n=1 Tax=Riemerella anatipestifer TaxID=34085 RepID=UPI0013737FB3|nr:hypothetical protein [Riemerella anatipestifer]MBT0549174.1 hypothetical protein [Riemerella anatipestifer]MBT0556171.1 hypothetical protein [Riemerella anatipestifer]MBT0559937.1 hypothetical protein [Riemerella anatipestifer]NAV16283.1 hypothetical protein [Riemerella anatipestifer]
MILLSDEEYTQIENLAGAGYGPNKIAMYLDVPYKDFMKEWNKPNSKVRYHYERGILMVDANAGMKLAENAMSGNITAHQQLEKVRRGQLLAELKKKYIYGEEEINGLQS